MLPPFFWLSLKVGQGFGDWDVGRGTWGRGDVGTWVLGDMGYKHALGLEDVGRRDWTSLFLPQRGPRERS